MNKDDSYQYIFFELLKFTEKIEVEYEHRALPAEYIDGITEIYGEYQWCLSIRSVSGKTRFDEYEKNLRKIRVDLVKYIVENRLDLYRFYDYFLLRIESDKNRIEKFLKDNFKLEELIKKEIISIQYRGYLPLNEHYELKQLGISVSPKDAEYDERSFNELSGSLKNYFSVLIQELTKLTLFIKHEINLTVSQKEEIKNQKGKREFLDLLGKGEIEQLFDELKSIEEFAYNPDIIQLSGRYFKLEKDKNKNIITRDEYTVQSDKLISSLINAILNM